MLNWLKRAAQLAGAFIERLGILPGDRVAIILPNCVEYLELLYATWFAGAAVVPINCKLHAREAAWIIENADAKAIFLSDDVATEIAPLLAGSVKAISVDSKDFAGLRRAEPLTRPVRRERDDLAWLFYTSGTTGKPKGVMISNGNLHAMTFSYFVDVDEVHRTDAIVYAAPMSHGAGLYSFMPILRGARHVVPETGGFEPGEILELGRTLDGISMFAAPTMVRRIVDLAKTTGSNGDGIRTIVYGGGPMYVQDIEDAVSVIWDRVSFKSTAKGRAQ